MKDGQLKNDKIIGGGKFSLNQEWTQHCFLDKTKMIGCTKDGNMFYIENNELRKEYENAFNSDEGNSYVVCIRKFSKGFFIGSQLGEMAMWVRSEENNSTSGKDAFDFIRKW